MAFWKESTADSFIVAVSTTSTTRMPHDPRRVKGTKKARLLYSSRAGMPAHSPATATAPHGQRRLVTDMTARDTPHRHDKSQGRIEGQAG